MNVPAPRATPPLVIAHRGAPFERRENTLPSILRARELGADRIEIDARRAAGGVLVLHHDDDLARSAGRPERVDRCTAAELARVPITFPEAPPADRTAGTAALPPDRVPLLSEAIAAARPVPLVVELKTVAAHAAEDAQRVLDVAAAEHAPPGTTLISFCREAVQVWLARRSQGRGFALGLVRNADAEYGSDGWRDALDLGVPIAVLSLKVATPERVAALRGGGCAVWLYSLDDAATLERWIASGIDGVVSNRPGLARGVVDRAGGGAPAP